MIKFIIARKLSLIFIFGCVYFMLTAASMHFADISALHVWILRFTSSALILWLCDWNVWRCSLDEAWGVTYCSSTQEFFSLAWSTVLMSRGGKASAQHCSILAAGGKKGLVKLIHPRNNVAYGEFRASRKSLSVLRFNHQQGNFLFSESCLHLTHLIVWQRSTSGRLKGDSAKFHSLISSIWK